MANTQANVGKKIVDFNPLTAGTTLPADLMVIHDVSVPETKKITLAEFSGYLSSTIIPTSSISASYAQTAGTANYALSASIPNTVPTSSYAITAGFAKDGGANNFGTIYVVSTGSTATITASAYNDIFTLNAGPGIALTATQPNNEITITNTGGGGGGGGGSTPGGVTNNVQYNTVIGGVEALGGDNGFVYVPGITKGFVGIKNSNPSYEVDCNGTINSNQYISTGTPNAVAFVGSASYALNANTASYAHNTAAADTLPIGAVLPFAFSTTPPNNWLACEGQIILVLSYLSLYTAIQQTYTGISGPSFGYKCNADGTPNISGLYFILPDLRGEVVRGFDNGRNIDTGRIFGSTQNGAFSSGASPINVALRYCIKYSNAANFVNLTATTVAGDVTGNLTATTVNSIQGIPIVATGATTNQVLTFNGTSWAASAGLSDFRNRYVKVSYIGDNYNIGSSGIWDTIYLNTKVSDFGSLANVTGNKITLVAGTYQVNINMYRFNIPLIEFMLGNDTIKTPLLVSGVFGTGLTGTLNGVAAGSFSGVITLATTTTLGLYCQHYDQDGIAATVNIGYLNDIANSSAPSGYPAISINKELTSIEFFKLI